MLYPAKKDWWLALPLALAAAVQIGGSIAIAAFALVSGNYLALLPAAAVLAGGVLIASLLLAANYEIGASDLIIRFGPVRWSIPLAALVEVVPVRGAAFEFGWGLAWSLTALRLRYRKTNGRLSQPIRISPNDRAAFLLELTEKVPALEVKEDGSLRRPAA
jgi:hypothetical protein